MNQLLPRVTAERRRALFDAQEGVGLELEAHAGQQEQVTAERMHAKIITLPSSHVPMLSHPKEVAEFVIGAAASLTQK